MSVTEVAPAQVTVADVLERAADLLGEFGWCQNSAGLDAHGYELALCDLALGEPVAFCYSGAIEKASLDLGLSSSPAGLVDGEVICWNDASGRTKAEVVARLRAAAAKARNG